MKYVYANLADKGWTKLTINDQINGYSPNQFLAKLIEDDLVNYNEKYFFVTHKNKTYHLAHSMLQIITVE